VEESRGDEHKFVQPVDTSIAAQLEQEVFSYYGFIFICYQGESLLFS
jgi:hypothetical protein